MEPASLGLLFGCCGAIVVFCGARHYAAKRWGAERSGEAEHAAIEAAYGRLALLRLAALLLGLAATGLWFLEPKPHAAGVLAALACLCLWRAWRVRGGILERLREEREGDAQFPRPRESGGEG